MSERLLTTSMLALLTILTRVYAENAPRFVVPASAGSTQLPLASPHAENSPAPNAAVPPAETPKVTVAKLQNKVITQSVQLPATFAADEQVQVYSKLSGYVSKLPVDRGDSVKKNDVIAELSVPEMTPELALAKAKVGAAQARIAKAQASVEVESATHHRLATLRAAEPGAVTQEDVDVSAAKEKTAKADADAVRAELSVAKADVDRLESLIGYLQLRAPFDGVVTERFVDVGAFVTPNTGAAKAIIELTRVSKLRLVFNIPERLVPFVTQGHHIRYTVSALPGKSFEGVVARRGGALTEDSHTMRLEADIDNASGALAPGMYGAVEIPMDKIAGAAVVPSSALRTIDGKTCVLAVAAGKLKKMRVESLLTDGPATVVSGELTPETVLVTKGPASLVDGQAVEVEPAK